MSPRWSYKNFAPLGLFLNIDPVFYKNVAPLGL